MKYINPFLKKIRNRHLFFLDIVLFSLSPFLALLLRVEDPRYIILHIGPILNYVAMALVIKILVNYFLDLYKKFWHVASIDELAKIILAFVLFNLFQNSLLQLLKYKIEFYWSIPNSLPLIDSFITYIFFTASRFSIRLAERIEQRQNFTGSGEKVLIYGAGKAGVKIVEEMQRHPNYGLNPVAFIDDDNKKIGLKIRGLSVIGGQDSFKKAIKDYKISKVIIAMTLLQGEEVRNIVNTCAKLGVKTRTLPNTFELLDNKVRVDSIRDIQIEDLLKRDPIQTDIKEVKNMLKGKKVLVTGAGGSIGSELCRQILNCNPSELFILGHGENSIFEIQNELTARKKKNLNHVIIKAIIADIRNKARIEQVLKDYMPDIVFHAAAHKHVPLMEMNACEAVTNNVLGTKNLIEACGKNDIQNFVMISTDKAVNPTSIMGATKRMAEMLVLKAAKEYGKNYVVVRFGNVLGSRGSVVLTFKKQIAEGGPITITHPDIVRYFMTIPEAVQLVLQAAEIGSGAEIFVLDMGKPIKIIDLAHDMISLSGYKPGEEIKIVTTGLRPGEKLYEELFITGEEYGRTVHKKIFIASNASSMIIDNIENTAETLISYTDTHNDDIVVNYLKESLVEFQHTNGLTLTNH
ncbi:MAG: polysaccharide biosynthesis protein [Ignavibacteria bacterium]|nr:polysaccharide biosynthesis protein [Ignavibacteria bacterium]